MIPESGQYIRLLMGAPGVSDAELDALGIEVVERVGADVLGLRVPALSLEAYQRVVREKLKPGFWNEVVGPDAIVFSFKLRDGTIIERVLSETNRHEIAQLCSLLNGDPIERTSDLFAYLAANSFYRDTMIEYYGVS